MKRGKSIQEDDETEMTSFDDITQYDITAFAATTGVAKVLLINATPATLTLADTEISTTFRIHLCHTVPTYNISLHF